MIILHTLADNTSKLIMIMLHQADNAWKTEMGVTKALMFCFPVNLFCSEPET